MLFSEEELENLRQIMRDDVAKMEALQNFGDELERRVRMIKERKREAD